MPYIIIIIVAFMAPGFAKAEAELIFDKVQFDETSVDYDKKINQSEKLAKLFESNKKTFPNATNLPDLEEANKKYISPKMLSVSAPVYSRELRRSGQEGRVEVILLISETGDVIDALIYKSTNNNLNEAAIQSAQSWKFSPASLNDVFRQSVVIAPIRFELNNKEPPPKKPHAFDAQLPTVDYLH